MTTTTLATLTVRYELSTGCREHLGPLALAVWSSALVDELELVLPGCDVAVDTRWASVDASRYSLTGTTTDGATIGGGRGHHGGCEVYDTSRVDSPIELLLSLARTIGYADAAAWDRACALASGGEV